MKINEFDQQLAEVKERMPAIYWAIYQGCIEKGFTEAQAMQILLAQIKPIGQA